MKRLLIVSFCLFFASFVLAEERVDINSAPLADLMKIVHIGEARAKELISLRPFSSLDDMIKIRGIGQSRLADIKNQGLAWIETAENSSLPNPIPTPKATPSVKLSLTEKESINLAIPAAIFTSLLSSGIIIILKKYVRT